MSGISRRRALQGLTGAFGAAMLPGCFGGDDAAAAGPEPDSSEGEFSLRCLGKDPKPQVGGPLQFQKYEKFVVLMMENRSFDHYFGHLSMPRSMGGEGRTDVDGLKGNEWNPTPEAGRVKVHKTTDFALGDIVHEWGPCRSQFNRGFNDGFVIAQADDIASKIGHCRQAVDPAIAKNGGRCGAPEDAMAYYGRDATPTYHSLMDDYALCDRWFSSVLGPTWPNRYLFNAGSAFGYKGESSALVQGLKTGLRGDKKTIYNALADKCVDAVNFFADVPWSTLALGKTLGLAPMFTGQKLPTGVSLLNGAGAPVAAALVAKSFEARCKDGTLPSVSFLDPKFLGANSDDHAPVDIRLGQAFVASVYNMLRQNVQQWQKTLFIITYDEHGGFYDHVAPPTTKFESAEFSQLGFRVPTLLVGPYVKKGIIKTQYDHVSVLSTLTRRFNLDPLNARVAQTADLSDCIDFNALERAPAEPIAMKSVGLSFSKAQDSIMESLGQQELGEGLGMKQMTPDQRREDLDNLLEHFDRTGAASVGR